MRQGPGGIARVSARVRIQQPRVARGLGEELTFAIHIPLEIDLLIDLRLDKQHFTVAGEIALLLAAESTTNQRSRCPPMESAISA